MRSKRFYSIIEKHWKKMIVILSLLIGTISIYPALHLIPIVYNVISTRVSRTNHATEKIFLIILSPQQQEEKNLFFLPLVQQSDYEPIEVVDESVLNTELRKIDISPTGEKITIVFNKKAENESSKSNGTISFLPGENCSFGDGRGCLYDYELPDNTRMILTSVHSGRGGEAELFRDLIEGTGINQGLYTTNQVFQNINTLIGSDIVIKQGDTEINGLSIKAIIRIPSAEIDTYLSLPIDHIISFARNISGIDLEMVSQDLFILETCGWRLPDEQQDTRYPNSQQSIYLGIFSFDD